MRLLQLFGASTFAKKKIQVRAWFHVAFISLQLLLALIESLNKSLLPADRVSHGPSSVHWLWNSGSSWS